MGGEGASVGGSSTCEVRSSAVSPWEGAGGGGLRVPAGRAAGPDRPQHLLAGSPRATRQRKELMNASAQTPSEELAIWRDNALSLRNYCQLRNASVWKQRM